MKEFPQCIAEALAARADLPCPVASVQHDDYTGQTFVWFKGGAVAIVQAAPQVMFTRDAAECAAVEATVGYANGNEDIADAISTWFSVPAYVGHLVESDIADALAAMTRALAKRPEKN